MNEARVPSTRLGLPRWLDRAVPAGVSPRAYMVVVAAAVAQTVTIISTWNLWRERVNPPNLPVLATLGHFDWAPVLLVLALVTIARPRMAAPLFCGAYVLAALGDQMRLQPEVVSLAFLMTAPLYGGPGRTVARWHLTTLWTWAGLHKALSLGWSTGGAGFIAASLGAPALRPIVAVALPAAELGVGVASAFRRAWPIARWAGAALNLGIFLTLSPIFGDWNSAVWPWNIALAFASVLLFSDEREHVAPDRLSTAFAVVLVSYPALFYFGLADAYLTHNLYTSNTATAEVCSAAHICSGGAFDTLSALNVPLPPEGRLYRAWFRQTCTPGSTLVVTGPATLLTGPPSVRRDSCPVRP